MTVQTFHTGSRPKTRLTHSLSVETDTVGTPVRVQWHSRWHEVTGEPTRWYQRRRWWLEELRAERGRAGLVASEIWRVQLSVEPAPRTRKLGDDETHQGPELTPGLHTVDLSRDPGSGRWRLLYVHEAVE